MASDVASNNAAVQLPAFQLSATLCSLARLAAGTSSIGLQQLAWAVWLAVRPSRRSHVGAAPPRAVAC